MPGTVGVSGTETARSARCAVHEAAEATGQCSRCQRAMCDGCTTTTPTGALLCTECVTSSSDRRRRIWNVAMMVVALAVIGVLAFVFMTSKVEQLSTDPTVPRDDDSEHMRGLREAWGRDKCTRKNSVDLGEALLRDEEYATALELVDKYEQECEVDRRVLWVRFTALKRLERWEDALAVADRLVRERPTDMNYWWWRAELRDRLGRTRGAAGDYRQSFANQPNSAASEGLETLRHCQSAFAWTVLVQIDPYEYAAERTRATDPFDRPACHALIGTGGASLSFDEVSGRLLATATVGAVELRAVVDTRAGTSVIAKSALARLGIAPSPGDEVTTRVGDGVVTGPTALLPTVDVQGARARQLGVVVADAFPGDVDLVLGVDFLWRFTRHDVDYGMLLAAWGSEPPEEPAEPEEEL